MLCQLWTFFFFSVEMYIISKTFRFYQTAQKNPLRYGLKTVSDRSPFHGQIYKKITNLKLVYMNSKQKIHWSFIRKIRAGKYPLLLAVSILILGYFCPARVKIIYNIIIFTICCKCIISMNFISLFSYVIDKFLYQH